MRLIPARVPEDSVTQLPQGLRPQSVFIEAERYWAVEIACHRTHVPEEAARAEVAAQGQAQPLRDGAVGTKQIHGEPQAFLSGYLRHRHHWAVRNPTLRFLPSNRKYSEVL